MELINSVHCHSGHVRSWAHLNSIDCTGHSETPSNAEVVSVSFLTITASGVLSSSVRL